MAIRQIAIEGYRSIQQLALEFEQINIITGHNGSGKSNLYKAIHLLSRAVQGQFSATLASEGGMPSIMWAGENRKANFDKNKARLGLSVELENYSYSIACGFPPNIPPSMFALDPEIKEEYVWHGHKKRPSTTILERIQNSAFITSQIGKKVAYPFCLNFSESVLHQLKEPHLYPELTEVNLEMGSWRFYHNFRTDAYSLIRTPQTCTRTMVLADDGYNLAAALQTIIEIGDEDGLHAAIDSAFPGAKLIIIDPYGKAQFQLGLNMPGILRSMMCSELSDGFTLPMPCRCIIKSPTALSNGFKRT